MNWQYIITGIIIASAMIYIVRSVYRSTQGHACESGNCKCDPKIQKKV